MDAGHPDWLDGVARFCASDSFRRVHVSAPAGAQVSPTHDGERLSRASVVRRSAIVAATIALGIWKSPIAEAQTVSRGECFDLCVTANDEIYTESLRSCDYALKPESWDKEGWARIRSLLRLGFLSAAWDKYREIEYINCRERALKEARDRVDECFQACRENCRPKRSLQSASSPAQTCEYKPPRKPKPPQIPPPPPTAPPPSQPADCNTLAPPGAVCCLLPSGDEVPCYTGCAKDGSGCCASSVGCG